MKSTDDNNNGLSELRAAISELRSSINDVRRQNPFVVPISPQLPMGADSWNFKTFEIYINQRFSDLSLQLRERYEAQQTGVTAALAAAEKAVNAALIAAEKAVDKAEGAQQLRNEAQNEFRKSLSDLSGLMWTTKEGTAMVESLRREWNASHNTVVTRVNALESGAANIQGRMWAIAAFFSLVAFLAEIATRVFFH